VRRRARAARLLVLASAFLAAACEPSSPPRGDAEPAARPASAAAAPVLPAPGAAAGRSLLLVTLDTTRADHLGCYGATGAETPSIDRLAARGLRFADAVSPVPMTLPAHTSLMTGLDPPAHGVRANGEYVLGPDAVTLAEALRGAGYRTAAFVSSFVLDPRYGLDQGFDTYDARLETTRAAAFAPQTERSAGAATAAALEWARTRPADGAPFFLWVHYFDAHDPYEPPEPFASRFREHPYDGEIAYVDHELGRLLGGLDGAGDLSGTVIVVAGDHGESLGEHGERYHSRSLYEGAVRVPLVLALPAALGAAAPQGTVGDRVVSLVDLYPTLLDLLGVPAPGGTDGRSLLREPAPGDRTVYLETLNPYLDNGWAPLYAARRHGLKYIRAPRPELYDLTEDPGEGRNLLAAGTAVAERAAPLREFLARRVGEGAGIPERAAAARRADPEVRRRLEALGYVTPGGGPPAGAEAPDELPDPKDMLPLLDELSEGRRLLAAGQPEEAARRARRILARAPRDRSALQLLGEAYATLGRTEDAERVLRRHLEVGPSVGACVLLAQVVMQQGRFDEAEALLDQAAALEPGHGAVLIGRGDLRLVEGHPREAVALYRRAAEVDPYRFEGLSRARIERVERLMAGRR
jgi:arylsulfatase A-like enzyme